MCFFSPCCFSFALLRIGDVKPRIWNMWEGYHTVRTSFMLIYYLQYQIFYKARNTLSSCSLTFNLGKSNKRYLIHREKNMIIIIPQKSKTRVTLCQLFFKSFAKVRNVDSQVFKILYWIALQECFFQMELMTKKLSHIIISISNDIKI